MRGLTPNPTKMEDPLLQELLQNADSEAPGELGSSDLQLLSLPLSQWKDVEHPVNFCIPAVPLEPVRTAEEVYHPYSNHWEDELLLQASQAFSQEQAEEEDALLLAASQEYEKRCGPLMTSDDVQSAVVAQVPLNTKRNNNWAANTWQAWAIGRNAASSSEWVNPDLNSVTDTDLAVWTPRFVLEVRNKDGEHYASSAVRTDSEGTAGMQKFTGCSTSFHWDSGSDRSCKSLLLSSPGASESAFWSSSCSSGDKSPHCHKSPRLINNLSTCG